MAQWASSILLARSFTIWTGVCPFARGGDGGAYTNRSAAAEQSTAEVSSGRNSQKANSTAIDLRHTTTYTPSLLTFTARHTHIRTTPDVPAPYQPTLRIPDPLQTHTRTNPKPKPSHPGAESRDNFHANHSTQTNSNSNISRQAHLELYGRAFCFSFFGIQSTSMGNPFLQAQ